MSVVIAARDAAQTLPATLASVRAQTFEDWEVVLVDDGSADATAEVARAADPRVRVLRNEASIGPAAARNRGAREARGELYSTLDADDTWHPSYLESQVGAFDRAVAAGRRVGAVCCDAELVAPGVVTVLWSERVGRVERVDVTAMLRENVVFGNVLAPLDVFLELGGYDERMGSSEDYDLWIRIVERGWEIVVNRDVLATYNLGGGTLSTKVALNARASQDMLARLVERGTLTPRQRRMAARRRRAHRVVELRALMAGESRCARKALLALRAAPLAAVSMLEHPQRWRHWLRGGLRSAGAGRHAWRS